MDCFCKTQYSALGFSVGKTNFSDLENRTVPVCAEWLADLWYGQALSYSISILLNVVNTILKLILIGLITSIKEDTKSAMMRSIKVGIFIT
jgi:hypothetical protein